MGLMDISMPMERMSQSKFNPFVPQESQLWADNIARIWNTRRVASMMAVFAPDCKVKYGDVRPFQGHAAIEAFLTNRFASLSAYALKKTFRLASKPYVCLELDLRWSSVKEPDATQRTRAFELLTLDDDGLIVRWEFVANPHPEGVS
jgi:nuclear transport factor 2 (NTF2) superfamily protein